MTIEQHIDAATKDAMHAGAIAPWDVRWTPAYARARKALSALFHAAAGRGPAMLDRIVSGYFKLSAAEPHRLPKLVGSIVALRMDDVARALLRYDAEH